MIKPHAYTEFMKGTSRCNQQNTGLAGLPSPLGGPLVRKILLGVFDSRFYRMWLRLVGLVLFLMSVLISLLLLYAIVSSFEG